jgi:uncharacterized OB-fold protein
LAVTITVKEYLAALAENRLLGLKCRDCGFITAPPRLSCRKCAGQHSDVVELSGKGAIATFTTVFIPPESRRGHTPYIIVLVELDEGPWIMGNLILQLKDPASASFSLIGKRVIMKNMPSSGKSVGEDGIAPQFQLVD